MGFLNARDEGFVGVKQKGGRARAPDTLRNHVRFGLQQGEHAVQACPCPVEANTPPACAERDP